MVGIFVAIGVLYLVEAVHMPKFLIGGIYNSDDPKLRRTLYKILRHRWLAVMSGVLWPLAFLALVCDALYQIFVLPIWRYIRIPEISPPESRCLPTQNSLELVDCG